MYAGRLCDVPPDFRDPHENGDILGRELVDDVLDQLVGVVLSTACAATILSERRCSELQCRGVVMVKGKIEAARWMGQSKYLQ